MFDNALRNRILEIFDEEDTQLVAVSKTSYMLVEALCKGFDLNPHVILAPSLYISAAAMVKRGIRKIVCIRILPKDGVDIITGIEALCDRLSWNIEIIDASLFVENNENLHTLAGETDYLNKLYSNLCDACSTFGVEFPEFRHQLKKDIIAKDVFLLLREHLAQFKQYVVYDNPNNVHGFVVTTKWRSSLTYQKMEIWLDEDTNEIVSVPMAPIAIADSIEQVAQLYRESYMAIVWDNVMGNYTNTKQLLGNKEHHVEALFLLADYIHSMAYYTYFYYQIFRYELFESVGSQMTKGRLVMNNLRALCGDDDLAKAFHTELSNAFGYHFGLKNEPTLRKMEQDGYLAFERVGGINPHLPVSDQMRIGEIILKSKQVENILAACYAHTDGHVSYPMPALQRAVDSSVSVLSNIQDECVALNRWLDEQVGKGAICRSYHCENKYWVSQYSKGLNALIYPQQIAMFVLGIYRACVKELKRKDIHQNLLRNVIAYVLMDDDDAIRNLARTLGLHSDIKTRSAYCHIGNTDIDVVEMLIAHFVFVVGDDLLVASEYWRGRDEWVSGNVTSDVEMVISRRVHTCLAPFERIPVHLFHVVMNAMFFSWEDFPEKRKLINQSMIKMQNLVRGLLSTQTDSSMAQKALMTSGQNIWKKLNSCIIEWNLAVSESEKIEDEPLRESYIQLQKDVHKVEIALRILLTVFFYSKLDLAVLLLNDSMRQIQYQGAPALDMTKLRKDLQELNIRKGGNREKVTRTFLQDIIDFLA